MPCVRLREQSAQDACDLFESLAVPLDMTLPTRANDLPKTLLSAAKSRLEANWDVISAWFGELHLKGWETLNGCTPFFRDESIMPDARSLFLIACCRLLGRSALFGMMSRTFFWLWP